MRPFVATPIYGGFAYFLASALGVGCWVVMCAPHGMSPVTQGTMRNAKICELRLETGNLLPPPGSCVLLSSPPPSTVISRISFVPRWVLGGNAPPRGMPPWTPRGAKIGELRVESSNLLPPTRVLRTLPSSPPSTAVSRISCFARWVSGVMCASRGMAPGSPRNASARCGTLK